jgi:KipI family sensor histidine kinase inhibitor
VIRPFGEAALLVDTGDADRAQLLADSLRTDPLDGVVGAVPGLASLLVELDGGVDRPAMNGALESRLDRATGTLPAARTRTIPVAYGGADGPDLAEVARLTGMSEDGVVRLHSSLEMRVLFSGFAPGFAYLGDLPAALRVPRLATPRTRTPPGSVAIAGSMSGIYPADLPGGWRIIGRTSVPLFDPHRHPPAYLVPGDRVRFRPVDPGEPPQVDDW